MKTSEPVATTYYGIWHKDGFMGLTQVQCDTEKEARYLLSEVDGAEGKTIGAVLTAAEVHMIQQAVVND